MTWSEAATWDSTTAPPPRRGGTQTPRMEPGLHNTYTTRTQSYLMVGVGAGTQTTHLSKYDNNKLYQAQAARTQNITPVWSRRLYCYFLCVCVCVCGFVSQHNRKPNHTLYTPTEGLSSGLQTCAERKRTRIKPKTRIMFSSGLHSVYCQSLWKIREGKQGGRFCVSFSFFF